MRLISKILQRIFKPDIAIVEGPDISMHLHFKAVMLCIKSCNHPDQYASLEKQVKQFNRKFENSKGFITKKLELEAAMQTLRIDLKLILIK
jgi:hypothetical protein